MWPDDTANLYAEERLFEFNFLEASAGGALMGTVSCDFDELKTGPLLAKCIDLYKSISEAENSAAQPEVVSASSHPLIGQHLIDAFPDGAEISVISDLDGDGVPEVIRLDPSQEYCGSKCYFPIYKFDPEAKSFKDVGYGYNGIPYFSEIVSHGWKVKIAESKNFDGVEKCTFSRFDIEKGYYVETDTVNIK